MPEFHFVRWFPSDYLRDTRQMSQCEHGAYFLLLNEYYSTGEPLPDNDRVLARVSVSDTLGDWLAIRPAIEKHFVVANGVWRHKRCDEELDAARSRLSSMKRGAEMTNQKRWGSPSDTPSDTPSVSVTVSQPVTSNQESESKEPESKEPERKEPRATASLLSVVGLHPEDQWEAETAFGMARKAGYDAEEINGQLAVMVRKGKSVKNCGNYLIATLKAKREVISNGKAPPKAEEPKPNYVDRSKYGEIRYD